MEHKKSSFWFLLIVEMFFPMSDDLNNLSFNFFPASRFELTPRDYEVAVIKESRKILFELIGAHEIFEYIF